MIFPDTFPNTRPAVYAPELKLDRHQDPYEGNLCVLPRASIHWRPSMTAAELVAERVPYLVDLVRAGGERLTNEEEPQGEPLSTYLLYAPVGCVIVPESALHLPEDITAGRISIRFAGESGWLEQALAPSPDFGWVGQALLEEVRGPTGAVLARADEPLAAWFSKPIWPGRWVRLDRPPKASNASGILAEIVKIHPDLDRRSFFRGYEVVACVLEDEVQQGIWEDSWFFLVLKNPGGRDAREFPIHNVRGLPYSPEHLGERIPELAPMKNACVALMGLGALGSEIAWQLARAQCGHLKLADRDHVEAATAVRWSNGMPAAGGLKPFVLKTGIEAEHPYVNVEPYWFMVGATPAAREGTSESEFLEAWMNDSQVMVDASAEQNVRRVVAYLAHPLRIPQIYVWSVDGYGGVVASIVPGETGCLLCLERALSPNGGYVEPPPSAENAERVQVQPRGCADRTFTGALVDLAPLAIEAARRTLQIICANSANGYPSPNNAIAVARFREPNGNVCVPVWKDYELAPNPSTCELCARLT